MRVACALAIALAGRLAGGTSGDGAARVEVEAPPELAGAARAVAALAREDFAAELRLVGLPDFGGPVRVVLAAEGSPAARHAPSWVSGYALGGLSTVVLFPGRVPSYPDGNLEALVRHELTHVLTDRAAAGRPLPRWFAEGLAIVGAREWGIEDRARAALAVLGRGPASLRELDDGFRGSAGDVNRSYALAGALVRSIQRAHGVDAPAHVLALVASGTPFGETFERATGSSLARQEHEFFGREALWNTWVPFLTSSTALWMGVTLLALAAIRRRRRRDAEARARWAAEEGAADQAWAEELERLRLESDDPRRHN